MKMNEEIVLYHGAKDIVQKPVFGYANTGNDYGPGFYCTDSLELAQEWACTATHGGYASQYTLNTSNLKVLDLCDAKHHPLNWLALLVKFRAFDLGYESALNRDYLLENFLPDSIPYDIITGYRADGSCFAIARGFLNNGISLRVLQKALKRGLTGRQTVLKSVIAIERLRFSGSTEAPRDTYYPLRFTRDRQAREDFAVLCDEPEQSGDLLMCDIRKQGVKADDPRIR